MALRHRLVHPLLGRRRFQWLFEGLLLVGIRGMNLDASTDPTVSGERALVERLARSAGGTTEPWTLFDVGANVGDWSASATEVLTGVGLAHTIWAFEPGRAAFERLAARTASLPTVRAERIALGAAEGRAVLRYDTAGSGLASLYPRRRVSLDHEEPVDIVTLDGFRERHGIGRIDLLKLDVEGHEVAVLEGAAKTLAAGLVDVVQFEFGGTNVDSRTFIRDIYDALDGFDVYRVLRDGLRPLGLWREHVEIFRLGNYVALRRR